MDSLLKLILSLVIDENWDCGKVWPQLEEEARESMEQLGKWIDAAVPDLNENDRAGDIIYGALAAHGEWKMACGFAAGVCLMAECLICPKHG